MASIAVQLAILAIQVGVQVAAESLRDNFTAGSLNKITGDITGENAPLAVVYGTNGTVKCTPLVIDIDKTSKKIRGSFGQTVGRRVKYHANMFVAVSDCLTAPITSIDKIYGGDKLIFDADPDIEATSSSITVTPVTVNGESMAVYSTTDADARLGRFRSGKDVTITGASNANNNGTFRCVAAKRDGSTTFVRVRNSSAVLCTSGCGTITISQTLDDFSDRDFRDIDTTTYLGTATQSSSGGYLESIYGAGEVENFRGISGFVTNRLRLDQHGNTIPSMRAVVTATSDLSDVVQDILDRVEREHQERGYNLNISRDTSALSGITVRGAEFRAPIDGIEALRNLAIAHDFVIQDRGGKLYFLLRSNLPEVAVRFSDLAAHNPRETFDRPFVGDAGEPADLPSEVQVSFLDPDQNYSEATVKEFRDDAPEPNPKRLNLSNMVLTEDEAKAIAAKALYLAESNQNAIQLNLPSRYAYVTENDVLTFTDDDAYDWRLIVTKVDRGFDGILRCECLEEQTTAPLSFTRDADDRDVEGEVIPQAPELDLRVWEHGPIDPIDAVNPTLYFGASSFDSDDDTGYELYMSRASDSGFVEVGFESAESIMGYATSTLAAPVTTATWDEVSTVDVELWEGALTSATESEILEDRVNWCRLGSEVIAFRTATSTGTNTYTLSGLLRGLFNTADQTSTHATGDGLIMISGDGSFGKLQFSPADIGSTFYFRAVPFGASVSDATSVSVNFTGKTVTPWAPGDIYGVRTSASAPTSGITIKWVRRTREPGPLVGNKPLLEDNERYRIRVLDSAGAGGGSVVGTYFVQGAERMFYSDLRQTADGLTPGDPVDVLVSQWSDTLQDYGDEAEGTAG